MNPKYPIERYGAVFDAHAHTYFDLHDASMTPLQLIGMTRRRGFNWVCALSHDTACGNRKIAKLAREQGLPCISGIEVSTIRNHLLGYGVQEWVYRHNTLDPSEVIDILRSQGCAVFLAHPTGNPTRIKDAFWYPNFVNRLDIDGIEWFNGGSFFLNLKAQKMLPNVPSGRRIAGSDAHHPATFGYGFTQVDINSEDPDDLVAAMRKGKCKPYCQDTPLLTFISTMLLALIENKIIRRKHIEGHWIKPNKDRPGSKVPDVPRTNKQWRESMVLKPVVRRWG